MCCESKTKLKIVDFWRLWVVGRPRFSSSVLKTATEQICVLGLGAVLGAADVGSSSLSQWVLLGRHLGAYMV